MISLDERYQKQAVNNIDLIQKGIDYMLTNYNIDIEELQANTKYYVLALLRDIRKNNGEVVILRNKRKKLNDDLDDLDRAFVLGDSLEINEGGRNTGGKPNTEEKRHIKRLTLREKLGQMVASTIQLEESLRDDNQMIIDLFSTIPQQQYIPVLRLTYIDNFPEIYIAKALIESPVWVKQAKRRGITSLVEIIRKSILILF